MGLLENYLSERADAANRLSVPDQATCWICLEGKSDNPNPLVRGCACRGEAGYGHLECIATFIKRKDDDNMGKINFHDPWEVCLTCTQPYSGQFYHNLARLRWMTYKDLNPKQNADSFYKFRGALEHCSYSLLELHRLDEALVMSQQLYELQKSQTEILGNGRTNFVWNTPDEIADTCNLLGGCYLKLQRYDEALEIFQEGMNYASASCHPPGRGGIDADDSNSSIAGVLMNNIAEVYVKMGRFKEAIRLRRQSIAVREAKSGKNSMDYIDASFALGSVLLQSGEAEKGKEGVELIKESKMIAQRVLGPHHQHVMKCDLSLQMGKHNSPVFLDQNMAEVVGLISRTELNGSMVNISSYNPDTGRYKAICNQGSSNEEIIGVKPTNVILQKGTKVVIRGLSSSKDLNGERGTVSKFHSDIGRYKIILDRSSKEIGVKPENAISY